MANKILTKVGTPEKYIPRDLEKAVGKFLAAPQILAIVGPRRSGKTTLLRHFESKLPNSIFLSFEDDDLLRLFEEDIKAFAKIYIQPYRNIILDEFQYAKKGGKHLKFLYDSHSGKKIIISGSSSIELTIKAAKFLVGRLLSFPLYPFSFKEFLLAKDPQLGKLIAQEEKPSPSFVKQVEPHLNEFLLFGGYPEVVLADDFLTKKTLLQNIYQLYFLKDVAALANLVEDWKLKNLARLLAVNLGGLTNYTQLTTAANIDFKTLKSYLNFLEKTFIILPVPPFFTNKTKEITKSPKIYFLDLGLRNALINSFEPILLRRDAGFLRENFIAAYLLNHNLEPHFWRTKSGAEVDFVVTKEGNPISIEIKSALGQMKTSRGLQSFIHHYRPREAFVANLNTFGRKKIDNTSTHFVPLFNDFLA